MKDSKCMHKTIAVSKYQIVARLNKWTPWYDGIVSKECTDESSQPQFFLFKESISKRNVQNDWKLTNFAAVFKKVL